MEAARNLKVNLKLEGHPCRSCQATLQLAEDASVCTACEAPHHARCWESKGGCATPECVNAPLKRLDPVPAPAPAPGWGAPPAYGSAPLPYAAASFPGGAPAPGWGAAPAAAAPPPPGMMACPHCRTFIMAGSQMCHYCRGITTPDGLYHGPKTNAPGAVSSMVFGIIGLLICGIIFGPIAISKAQSAKQELQFNPTYGGAGFATAGLVLGIVDIALWGLLLFARVGG